MYDPSYIVNGGVCRGYIGVKSDRVDCKATPGNDIRRLCNCIDKGMPAFKKQWSDRE